VQKGNYKGKKAQMRKEKKKIKREYKRGNN
jgi:hypothetical protein